MIRRSKIKARPVIKKAQSSAATGSRSTSHQKIQNTSQTAGHQTILQNEDESPKHTAQNIVEAQPKVIQSETPTGVDDITQLQLDATSRIQSSNVASESTVKRPDQDAKLTKCTSSQARESCKDSTSQDSQIAQFGRRRKLVACPSTSSKRPKLANPNVKSSPKTKETDIKLMEGPAAQEASSVNFSNDVNCVARSEQSLPSTKDQPQPSGVEMQQPVLQNCPPSREVCSSISSSTAISQHSVTDVAYNSTKKSPGEEAKSGKAGVQKTATPSTRRRKVVACPTMGRKRQRCDRSVSTADVNSANHCAPNTTMSVAGDDAMQCNSLLPVITEGNEAAEISDASLLPVEVVVVDEATIEEPSGDVAVLTTVVTEIPDTTTCNDLANPMDSNSNEAQLISNYALHQGLSASHDVESMPIALPNSFADQNEQVQTVQLASKAPVNSGILSTRKCDTKVKAKSLSYQYRSKAMEKLKKLKQDQDDSSKWPELDQNYVSMSDLIFLNPPAEVGHRLGMNSDINEEQESTPVITTENVDESEKQAPEDQDDAPLPVPQIRIAEDGSVVVDEESLVLDTQKPVDPTVSTVYESGRDNAVNQRSFTRRAFPKAIRWSIEDTNKFYNCLQIVGAEFSLMSAMFRSKSSDDLRRKFKRERKLNPNRVDEALMRQHLNKWTDDMFELPQSQRTSSVCSPQQAVI